MRDFISERAQVIPPSGIRKFFDLVLTMQGVISLGSGSLTFPPHGTSANQVFTLSSRGVPRTRQIKDYNPSGKPSPAILASTITSPTTATTKLS